jgi:hypothetical protein
VTQSEEMFKECKIRKHKKYDKKEAIKKETWREEKQHLQ